MQPVLRGIFWSGVYVIGVTLPLLVGALSIPGGGPASLGVGLAGGLGYVALSMLALELALVSRMDEAAGAFGLDTLLRFHREAGVAALLLVGAHVGLLVPRAYPWAVLGAGPSVPWPIRAGTLAALLVLGLVVSSIWRRRFRLRYETWQLLHGLGAVAVLGLGALHVGALGRASASLPMRIVGALYLVLFLGVLFRHRLLRPLWLFRHPWTVVDNRPEAGASRTLVVRPEGHPGFSFQPGQFSWLGTGRTPFHLEQHPVSMSSSGEVPPCGPLSFTIRALGDWSGGVVPALRPGDRVWVDGPWGAFTPDRAEGPGWVLIGGGVGVAPLVSMVETLADREDRRPVLVVQGAGGPGDRTLGERLDALRSRLDLRVVPVMEHPPPGWSGERGRIDAELLRRHLPRGFRRLQYFVCGPPALLDAMDRVLPALGIPADRIHAERLEMA